MNYIYLTPEYVSDHPEELELLIGMRKKEVDCEYIVAIETRALL